MRQEFDTLVEIRRFEMPEPALDFPTFQALIRLRSKVVQARAQYIVQQQAEESHESGQPSVVPPKGPPKEQETAGETGDCSRDRKEEAHASVPRSYQRDVEQPRRQPERKSRTSILEAKKAELMAKRVFAAQQLSEHQKKLAEVQERVEKLNEDKHELVIRLKQALQQEGSLKKQATLGSFTPMSPRADQAAADAAAAPLMAGDGAIPQQPNPVASPVQAQQPSRREPHAGGPSSAWSRDDEGELIEEGEVIPSPKPSWPEVHGVSPVNPSSTVMRNSWLPPHLQAPGGLVRTPSWSSQQQPLPSSSSQLPPHLKRQNSSSFQPPPAPPQPAGMYLGQGAGAIQGGALRPRQGHVPPPGWGGRDGGGAAAWQHGSGTLPNTMGRRGQYPY